MVCRFLYNSQFIIVTHKSSAHCWNCISLIEYRVNSESFESSVNRVVVATYCVNNQMPIQRDSRERNQCHSQSISLVRRNRKLLVATMPIVTRSRARQLKRDRDEMEKEDKSIKNIEGKLHTKHILISLVNTHHLQSSGSQKRKKGNY